MKLIFLDIDGVLNHEAFYLKRANGNLIVPAYSDKAEICPEALSNLNTLVSNTGAKVVISSTWRLGKTVEWFKKFFFDLGFVGDVLDVTPDMRRECVFRGNEIHKWMSDNRDKLGAELHKYRGYVILDDDSDMLYWQRNNFILVDRFVGLTKGTVFQAEKILNP